jgi:hypothetical protein
MKDSEKKLVLLEAEIEAKEILEGKDEQFMLGFQAGYTWMNKYFKELLGMAGDVDVL